MTKRPELTDVEKHILSLVMQAFSIQDAIEAKRGQLVKGGKTDESLQAALRDLTNQFEGLVDQAAIEQGSARIARLKREIRTGARFPAPRTGAVGILARILDRSAKPTLGEETPRSQPEIPTPELTSHSPAATQTQPSLDEISERLIGLAGRVLKAPASGQDPRDQLMTQMIGAASAETEYKNAKLVREVAEIKVIENTEGVFRQDQATADGEIVLARSDIPRAQEQAQNAKDRLARITALSGNSLSDLRLVQFYADQVAAAELRERNAEARDTLKQAEAKKMILANYTQPKRKKQLEAEVEKSRAEELAKQAVWESAKTREARLRKAIQRPTSDNNTKRILALIERAIPIEEQLYGKAIQIAKGQRINDLLSKEIHDLTYELMAIVDEGEALWSAGELIRLKPRVEAAIRPANPASAK